MATEQINAEWAKRAAIESRLPELSDESWFDYIIKRIEDAAYGGRRYIELNLRNPSNTLYGMLRQLGFTVNVVSYQRDGEWTRVSW